MKKIIISIAAMLSMLSAGGCVVEPVSPVVPVTPLEQPSLSTGNFYVGGALSLVSARKASTDLDFFNDKRGQDRIVNLMLLSGYNFNKYFAVEGRVTASIAKQSFTKYTGFSLFAKPQYPISNNFNVYGLLGFGVVNLDKYHGSNVDVSKASFQWGAGVNYNINDRWAVFADYTSLANNIKGTFLNSKKVDVDSINVGVIYKF
jgi:opacity protein-like surface antigen